MKQVGGCHGPQVHVRSDVKPCRHKNTSCQQIDTAHCDRSNYSEILKMEAGSGIVEADGESTKLAASERRQFSQ